MTEPTVFSPFTYEPGPDTPPPEPAPPTPSDIGPLAGLQGSWVGTGFNAIWRPSHSTQDRFLELNLTSETLDFDPEGLGEIPNRGFLQDDLTMAGVRYLQRIKDANLGEGLHIEPGLWLTIPATTAPLVPGTVARLASIPHGTTIVAQGTSSSSDGPPMFPTTSLNPFPIDHPESASPFPEQNLAAPTEFRTKDVGLTGITQSMIDNPNSVLTATASGPAVSQTVTLDVTTANTPVLGGGTANTAFLQGAPGAGPNAQAVLVTATFWLQTLAGDSGPTRLQYSQTVLLNFNGLSWPHITVATLTKQPST